jgi:hypothetical protein
MWKQKEKETIDDWNLLDLEGQRSEIATIQEEFWVLTATNANPVEG